MHSMSRRFLRVTLLVSLQGCGASELDTTADIASVHQAITIPAKGSSTTLDVGSWNLEWFGDASNGPSDETLQLNNVQSVIAGADIDIWGVAEVVSTTQWNTLKSRLSGYSGLLANDASVVNGPSYYSSGEQKVGILYKSSIAVVQDARVILTSYDSDFAGRPPLQVTLQITLNGTSESVVVIVMHPKCCSDTTSWQRRVNASTALKSYLDSTYPTQKVWVIGDFNDDVDTSITTGHASPYANFVTDAARYRFPTKELSDTGYASTVDYPDMIDHHLNSNESNALYLANTAEVFRVDQYISNYGTTTSDHYPVVSRYSWAGSGTGGASGSGGASSTGGGSSTGTPDVIINEIGANEPGSDTAGEFIELVNAGTGAANLSGWTLSDATSVRHTFSSGTSLSAGKAVVVFAGSSAIPGGLGNAVVASTGSLSLANGGDTVTLKNSSGTSVDGYTYSSTLASLDGVSMNLSPDGSTSGSFVKHTAVSSLDSSPGKRANGSDW